MTAKGIFKLGFAGFVEAPASKALHFVQVSASDEHEQQLGMIYAVAHFVVQIGVQLLLIDPRLETALAECRIYLEDSLVIVASKLPPAWVDQIDKLSTDAGEKVVHYTRRTESAEEYHRRSGVEEVCVGPTRRRDNKGRDTNQGENSNEPIRYLSAQGKQSAGRPFP
eukprot:2326524-Prymnesium_polylepis.2